jgi:hypothetical protein
MTPLLLALVLSQTQPAVRRSTPLSDDPGMVTRNIPSGTQNVNVVGGGPLVPGAPDGGLIGTVRAIGPDGGAVPVQGSISATNPSVGPTASTVPAQATLVGGPDSSNLLRAPFVLTTTPDAGDPGLVVRIVGGGGGGGGGGVVTQGTVPWLVAGVDAGAVPVQGTVAVSSVGGTVAISAASLPLPAGAATEATLATRASETTLSTRASETTLSTRLADSTFTGRINTLGQKTMANSTPVVIASDQSAIAVTTTPPANASTNVTQFGGNPVVTGTGASGVGIPRVTVSNDSTVTANAGTGTFTVGQATAANLRAQTSSESNTAAAVPAQASMAGGSDGTNLRALRVATDGTVRVDPTGTTTQPVSGTVTVAQPVAANLNATVTGTVAATQSGTWTVRNQDGVGNSLASSTSAPGGAEQALIVRNIPSGTQTVSGTVTASGTVTSNQGTPNSTANRWPVQLTDGTDLSQVSAAGALIVDGSATTQPVSGTVTANAGTGNFQTNLAQVAGTPASTGSGVVGAGTLRVVLPTDQPAVAVTPSALTDITGAGTLNALNATCAVALTGRQGASFLIAAGTLAATTIAEVSPDLGTTWFQTLFVNVNTFAPSGALVTTNPNAATMLQPYLPAGTTNVRLRVSVFTSGTAACSARATNNTQKVLDPTDAVDGVAVATGVVRVVGATDAANLPTPLRVDTNGALRANLSRVGDTAVDVNAGNAGAGTQRVVLASNQARVDINIGKRAANPATSSISCATSATNLTPSPLASRTSLVITNNGANTIFLGGSTVTTATGTPLVPGATFSDDVGSQGYFCIVAAGTENARVLEN